jgi:hypothetical protein
MNPWTLKMLIESEYEKWYGHKPSDEDIRLWRSKYPSGRLPIRYSIHKYDPEGRKPARTLGILRKTIKVKMAN